MLRIGSLLGTNVLVAPSFFLIVAIIAILIAPVAEAAAPGLGAWKYVAGAIFALMLWFSVLLHEAAHAAMARRYGFPVGAITLEFLGGFTSIEGEARAPRQEFMIAVVGPITSLIVGAVAWVVAQVVPGDLVQMTLVGVAIANLLVGFLNLVPGLPLDGGRLLKAGVWSLTGDMHRGTLVAGWVGRAVAVACLAYPAWLWWATESGPDLYTLLMAFVIAGFLWTGATAAMSSARLRRRLPGLVARRLARPSIALPADLPLSEALRQAEAAGAHSIITVTADGTPVGIVSDTALSATPDDRRPWVSVAAVARGLDQGGTLPAAIAGEELVVAISRAPAEQYLLVEPDGQVAGVLVTDDVDQAFRAGR